MNDSGNESDPIFDGDEEFITRGQHWRAHQAVRQRFERLETELKQAQEEKERLRRRDNVTPRHFDFKGNGSPHPDNYHHDGRKTRKVMATPKNNLNKALEILEKRDDKDAIDHVKQLLGTGMPRSSFVDTVSWGPFGGLDNVFCDRKLSC